MTFYILLSLICWIVIYPLDSVICPLYNWALVWNKGELESTHFTYLTIVSSFSVYYELFQSLEDF